MSWYDPVLDLNVLPDPVLRFGIRKLLRDRLAQEDHVRAPASSRSMCSGGLLTWAHAGGADRGLREASRPTWRPSWRS